jgi:hypothetical protein
MAGRIQVTSKLPWDRPVGNNFWRDADTAQLISLIDIRYGSFSSRIHDISFTKTADDRRFHPIRDYLDALPQWEGVTRVETCSNTLKADDTPYIRAVTRKPLLRRSPASIGRGSSSTASCAGRRAGIGKSPSSRTWWAAVTIRSPSR